MDALFLHNYYSHRNNLVISDQPLSAFRTRDATRSTAPAPYPVDGCALLLPRPTCFLSDSTCRQPSPTRICRGCQWLLEERLSDWGVV